MNPTSDMQTSRATTGERLLQDRLGTRERAERFYDKQVLDHLNEPMRRFIERQQMMFLSTSDAQGSCDSTLRAGPPGFVIVLDQRRLAWPEYRGNGVMASLGNIAENPHVGLLFVDFVRDVIGLHVNGGAELVDDDELRMAYPDLPVDPVPGRRAEQWVVAHVHEAYIHCAKHIPRLYEDPREGQRQRLPQPKKSDYFAVENANRPAAQPGERGGASLPARPPKRRPATPAEVRVCKPVVTSPPVTADRGTATWRHRLRHILPRRLRDSA
jgi:hypothetical protein